MGSFQARGPRVLCLDQRSDVPNFQIVEDTSIGYGTQQSSGFHDEPIAQL